MGKFMYQKYDPNTGKAISDYFTPRKPVIHANETTGSRQ